MLQSEASAGSPSLASEVPQSRRMNKKMTSSITMFKEKARSYPTNVGELTTLLCVLDASIHVAFGGAG